MNDRSVGIEIENESLSMNYRDVALRLNHSQSWEVERDGSLREGGWEIKTTHPGLPLRQALLSLNELYPIMVNSSGVWRAAIHVHVDAGDLTWGQRAIALAMSYILDDSIFEFFSPERRESNFCVPLNSKADSVRRAIMAMLLRRCLSDEEVVYGKYSSVNINSLFRFGTFEFRHMRTPACGETVAQVTESLNKIERFTRASHDIVNAVANYTTVESRGCSLAYKVELALESVLTMAGAASSLFPSYLRVDEEALADVVTWLEAWGKVIDTTALDLGTVVACVPARRRFTPAPSPPVYLRQLVEEMVEERTGSDDVNDIFGGDE